MDSPEFSLLSDRLKLMAQNAEEQRVPVLVNWLARGLQGTDLERGDFDEEWLLARVQKMLGDLDSFCVLPAILVDLREYMSILEERRQLYLVFALKRQVQRIEKLLQGLPNGDLEKRRLDCVRYLEKATTELRFLTSEEELQRLENSFNRRLQKEADKVKLAYARKQPTPEMMFVIACQLMKLSEALLKDITDKHDRRITKTKQSFEALTRELEVLEVQADLKKKLLVLLTATRSRLTELQGCKAPDCLEKPPSTPPVPSSPKIVLRDIGAGGAPPSNRPGKSDLRKPSPLPPKNGFDRPFSNSIEPGEFTDYERLCSLVQLANEQNTGIRVLVPAKQAGRYRAGWQQLLDQLGLVGELVCVHYGELKRTRDLDTPVIVPKKMNTHHGKWDRLVFKNLMVVEVSSPKLLLAVIEKKKIAN